MFKIKTSPRKVSKAKKQSNIFVKALQTNKTFLIYGLEMSFQIIPKPIMLPSPKKQKKSEQKYEFWGDIEQQESIEKDEKDNVSNSNNLSRALFLNNYA